MLGSCQKESIGPELSGIYGPVTVLQSLAVSESTVDFSANERVYFTAQFEKDAVWTLTLIGQTSGATKTFKGISSALDSLITLWNGYADGAPSFQAEMVEAALSFDYLDTDTQKVSFQISAAPNLIRAGDVLVSEFIVNKSQCYCSPPIQPDRWPTDFPPTVNNETAYGFPDGNAYLVMGGTGANAVPWQGAGSPYVDILTIEAKNADTDYGTYFPLYADPAKVYFNIMVHASETQNAVLRVFLLEDAVVARYIDIMPNWTGWRLISLNYTQLIPAVTTPAVPNRVTAVQFVLLSNSNVLPGNPVKIAFDRVIFTHNVPYQP
jgi:hypothetical protein